MRYLAVVLALVCACEKDPQAEKPAPRPEIVVADISRASATSLDGLRAFVGKVSPMAVLALHDGLILGQLAQGIDAKSLDGLDPKAPLHVLVTDGPKGGDAVLVAKIGDAKQLEAGKGSATIVTRDGWAVLGHEATVNEVADYALATVAKA